MTDYGDNDPAVTDDWCDVTGYEDDLETHELDELARDDEGGDDDREEEDDARPAD